MSTSRRDFLKFVVAGSVAAGCPFDLRLLGAPAGSKPGVDGEHYEICHQVRNGHHFPRPPVSKRYDVVIGGGGVSGLTTAYLLQSKEFLLLEKEPHWGGNAYLEEYDGQAFATGAAFEISGEPGDLLAKEIGLKLLPIDNPDPTIVNGVWVPDTWRTGIDILPYPESVRESFKKFRRDVLALDLRKNVEKYDNEPFSNYCAGYAPEIKQWWDNYGPSNWGAATTDTSALLALEELQDIGNDSGEDPRVTLPGGLGVITERLAEVLAPKHRERMKADATIVAVEPQKNEVHITFLHEGKLATVAAKVVVMATPKFITRRIVSGLPPEQSEAMDKIRYAPYPVVNLIFNKPIYNRGYDTWCPGNSFTDFIVADWTVRNQPGYKAKNNILTFYVPLREGERDRQLAIEGCREIALNVLRDFQKLQPEFHAEPVEVHLYRRGHPLFMSTPGNFTRVIPAANRPMERIFFANTDSVGPESLTSGGVVAAHRAAEWVEQRLTGKTSDQAEAAARACAAE